MNRNRRKKELRKRGNRAVITIIASLLVAIIISFNSNQGLALADNEKTTEAHYISIEIESGENLWTIAAKYKDQNQSTPSYIAELKQINNFGSNEIREGDYLIVADYTL